MIRAAVACVALLALPGLARGAGPLDAREGDWMVVVEQGGGARLAASLGAALGGAGLDVETPDRLGLRVDAVVGCSADRRFTCWVEHVDAQQARPGRARFILVGRVEEGPEGARVSLLVLDADAARRELAAAHGAADTVAVEDQLFTTSVRTLSDPIGSEGLEGLLRRRLDGALSDLRRRTPLATLLVEGAPLEAEVRLDGRVLGRVSDRRLRIEGVRTGTRRLELGTRQHHLLVADPVTVVEAPRRPALLGTGAALVAAGLVAATAGWVLAGDGLQTSCVGASSCDRLGAVRLDRDADARVTWAVDEVRGGGPSWAALSVGLIGWGATWLVGALTTEADDPTPLWLGPAVGVAGWGVTELVVP